MRWVLLPDIFGPRKSSVSPAVPDTEPDDKPHLRLAGSGDPEPDDDHLTAGGVILRVLVLLFVACLIFGGAATFGWLHHAWTFVDGVFHSKNPTVHIPIPHVSLPTTPVSS